MYTICIQYVQHKAQYVQDETQLTIKSAVMAASGIYMYIHDMYENICIYIPTHIYIYTGNNYICTCIYTGKNSRLNQQ